MKRVFSFLLAVIIMLSVLSITGTAGESYIITSDMVEVSSVTAHPGDVFTITFTLKDAPRISAFGIFDFDKSPFELVDADCVSSNPVIIDVSETDGIVAAYTGPVDLNGEFLSVTMRSEKSDECGVYEFDLDWGVETEGSDGIQDFTTSVRVELSHMHTSPVVEPGADSTCEKGGYYYSVEYCGVCGTELSREKIVIPVSEHDFSTSWKYDAECHWHNCAVCNVRSDAEKHVFDSGIVTRKPTSSVYGEKTYTCICGYQKTEQMPKIEIVGEILLETVGGSTLTDGMTVDIPVNIVKNDGAMYMKLFLEYDHDVFEFIDAESGTTGFGKPSVAQNGNSLVFDADGDVRSTGTLTVLRFRVRENAVKGACTVTVSGREAFNYNEDELGIGTASAAFNIISLVYGDANGDEKVDGKDLIRLRKYLANYDPELGSSNTECFPGADANGDGTIDGKDLVRLRKYLTDYDEDTGMSAVKLGPDV